MGLGDLVRHISFGGLVFAFQLSIDERATGKIAGLEVGVGFAKRSVSSFIHFSCIFRS